MYSQVLVRILLHSYVLLRTCTYAYLLVVLTRSHGPSIVYAVGGVKLTCLTESAGEAWRTGPDWTSVCVRV